VNPKEIMGVLREYHAEMGADDSCPRRTLERFAGDGMMVFFNDPVQVPDPAARAVRMVLEMRERLAELTAKWRKRGFDSVSAPASRQGFRDYRRGRFRRKMGLWRDRNGDQSCGTLVQRSQSPGRS